MNVCDVLHVCDDYIYMLALYMYVHHALFFYKMKTCFSKNKIGETRPPLGGNVSEECDCNAPDERHLDR